MCNQSPNEEEKENMAAKISKLWTKDAQLILNRTDAKKKKTRDIIIRLLNSKDKKSWT